MKGLTYCFEGMTAFSCSKIHMVHNEPFKNLLTMYFCNWTNFALCCIKWKRKYQI